MAAIISQTRKQLRGSIGDGLGAVVKSTTTSLGATNTFIDTELPDADGSQQGKHFIQTSGTNDGSIRIVDEYIGGNKTGRFRTVMGAAVASGVTYELWDEDMPPACVHDAINRAIRAIPRKAAPPSTDTTIHSSRQINGYALPTALKGIQRVEYRVYPNYESLHECDSNWTESSGANTTATLDNEDYRQGNGSVQFVVGAGVGDGEILGSTTLLSSDGDLRSTTHFECWMKAELATAAGDLAAILSDTASAGAETDKIAIPALVANTWTRVRVALNNPWDDSAIISVGLEYDANSKANTIWIDGVETVQEDSGNWEFVHRNYWRIDKDERKLYFDHEGRRQIGHSRLKLTGRKEPTELTSDATACDVDPEYIIEFALSNLMRARADRNASSREAAHIEADRLMLSAIRRAARIQTPSGVRWVDN